MAQIVLNFGSPLTLLKGFKVAQSGNTCFLDDLESLKAEVFPHIQALVSENTSAILDSCLSQYVSRVASSLERAWFTKLASNIIQPVARVSVPLLAAVELRYLFELILDDIADCSTERRGGVPLHLQVGISKAIYLAEILMGTATESLGEALESADVSKQMFSMALKSWGRKNTIVSTAQYHDLTYEHMSLSEVTPAMAIDLIDAATGQDLANCFFLGGLVAGASIDSLNRLHRIGQCVGMLMQMRDDLLDYVNDAQIINKEPLLDFKNSRKKVPLVVAFHHASDLEKQEILALMQQTDFSPEDITRIQQFILNPAAIAYQSDLCNEFIRQIDENLEALNAQGEAAETLRLFVHRHLKLDI